MGSALLGEVERGKGWSLRLRGEESGAKAGAFAYAGGERGKGWSLRLRSYAGFTGSALPLEPGRA